jgi:hypothetical protein
MSSVLAVRAAPNSSASVLGVYRRRNVACTASPQDSRGKGLLGQLQELGEQDPLPTLQPRRPRLMVGRFADAGPIGMTIGKDVQRVRVESMEDQPPAPSL